jgi:hypothetical protein
VPLTAVISGTPRSITGGRSPSSGPVNRLITSICKQGVASPSLASSTGKKLNSNSLSMILAPYGSEVQQRALRSRCRPPPQSGLDAVQLGRVPAVGDRSLTAELAADQSERPSLTAVWCSELRGCSCHGRRRALPAGRRSLPRLQEVSRDLARGQPGPARAVIGALGFAGPGGAGDRDCVAGCVRAGADERRGRLGLRRWSI